MFTDPQERNTENRARREGRIISLKNELLRSNGNPLMPLFRGLMEIQKKSPYISAFLYIDPGEAEYDRTSIQADYGNRKDWDKLFDMEKDCLEKQNGFDMDCAIPVIECPGGFTIECVVMKATEN